MGKARETPGFRSQQLRSQPTFLLSKLRSAVLLGLMDIGDLQVPLAGFEDVTPIPQDDGPDPVVSIAYKHNCECSGFVSSGLDRRRG